jgi:integrase
VVRSLLPQRFYLFRYPLNNWKRGVEGPPTYAVFVQFFHNALEELERRLLEEEPESAVQIITERDAQGRPIKAIFTGHGTRSAVLTALLNGGAPIGILSKLVAGHSTMLMTLRYVTFDPAHISEVLSDALTKSVADTQKQFASFLKGATLTQAMRMTARLTDDGFPSIWPQAR